MPSSKTHRRRAVEVVTVGLAYYLAARVGLLMQLPGTNASPVWPPSGIALAGMLLFGLDVWPGIAVAAFLANVLTLPSTVAGFVAAAAIALGNTVEPVLAVAVLRRACPSLDPFERVKSAFVFVGCAVVVCLVAATNGTSVLRLVGILRADVYRSAWLTWWVGDLTGMVILGPALYAWGRKPRLELTTSRLLELSGLVALTGLIGELLFGGWVSVQFTASRPYLPILLWAAFRFGQRETSSLAALVSGQAVIHTWLAMQAPGRAPVNVMAMLFVNTTATPIDWVRALQLFLCITSVLSMVVAAAVAERETSERAMHESEQRFRTIFEQAAVGVALIETMTGRFSRVNQRYCDIVGRTADDMLGITFQAITHPDDLAADRHNMARMTAGTISQFSMEERFCRVDGSTVWVNVTVSPTWKPGERPNYHIAIVEDITTRKRAEQLFRLSVEAAPTAMVMTDHDGRIVLINDETERLFGYDRRELLGEHVECLMPERFRESHPTHRAEFGVALRKHQMGGGRDLYGVRKNGTEFPVEIGLNPVQTEQGPFILSAIADITPRKQLETTLRNLNRTLEEGVRDRTWQLEAANRELEAQVLERHRAETALRCSLQEKETLLREVHHRVKNNLAVVSGLLYLEETQANDAGAVNALQESQHRIRSMAMVHEKLYRSGNLAAVNSRDYVSALLDYLLQSYADTSGHVTVRTQLDELLLDADTAVPCGLIVTELVTNSLKHAFPAGRNGILRVELRKGTNGHHRLSVEDDGIGIPPGRSIDDAATLGWRLVRLLTNQLDGTFTVRPSAPGLEVTLQFPNKDFELS